MDRMIAIKEYRKHCVLELVHIWFCSGVELMYIEPKFWFQMFNDFVVLLENRRDYFPNIL